MKNRFKCSVCIPTFKRPENLNIVLAQLLALKDKRINDIVIAVTGDPNESLNRDTYALLHSMILEGIDYQLVAHLTGLYEAKRLFTDIAKSDILLILDDDVLITKDYLKLLKHFKDKNVAAVSGSLDAPLRWGYYQDADISPIDNPPEGSVCNRVEFYPEVNPQTFYIKDKYQGFRLKYPAVYKCQALAECSLFIRKELLKPDKRFYRGASLFGEFDYTYSLYLQGYDLLFDSSQQSYHFKADAGGCRCDHNDFEAENARLFINKYYHYDR